MIREAEVDRARQLTDSLASCASDWLVRRLRYGCDLSDGGTEGGGGGAPSHYTHPCHVSLESTHGRQVTADNLREAGSLSRKKKANEARQKKLEAAEAKKANKAHIKSLKSERERNATYDKYAADFLAPV